MFIWCVFGISVFALCISFIALWSNYCAMCEIISVLDEHIETLTELEKQRNADSEMMKDG